MLSASEVVKLQKQDGTIGTFERALLAGTVSQEDISAMRVGFAARIAAASTPEHVSLWTYRAELLEATVAAYS